MLNIFLKKNILINGYFCCCCRCCCELLRLGLLIEDDIIYILQGDWLLLAKPWQIYGALWCKEKKHVYLEALTKTFYSS